MTNKEIDVSLVLATYKEGEHFADSIDRIVNALDNSPFKYEIIIVDDFSPDNTVQLIKKSQKKYSKIKTYFHNKNYGRGKSVTDGILSSRGEVVGYIDVDLEVGPEYMYEMINIIKQKKADFVIGKRIYRTSIKSFIREILSTGYQLLANSLIGTGKYDTESGYKFFNRKKILKVLPYATSPHWFWDTEIVVYSVLQGLNVFEIPVLFIRRNDKTSTVNIIPDTIQYIKNLWNLYFKLKKGIKF